MQTHSADPKPSSFSTQFPSEGFTNRFVDPSLSIQANIYDSFQENAMPSDGRYPYPGPPHPAMTYDYSAYPPAPYDPAHYPPPHQPQRQILPPAYHQYPSATHPHYGIPPQQWSPDAWSHYGFIQSMHPPPIQDPSRPDMNSISVDPNRYPPSTPSRPPESSIAGATDPLTESHPSSTQDRSKPSTSELSPSSPSFDFMKIVDTCRIIIDSSSPFVSDATLNAPGRPPPAEVMDRMLASANTTLKIMEAAVKEAEGRKSESGNSSEQIVNGNGHTSAAPREPSTSPKPSETPQVPEGQTCLVCKATSTPEWRRGPMGPRTLCNACGLVYAKLIKKRGREARARTNGNGTSPKAETDNLDELAGISSEDKSDDDDDDDEISADEG